MLVSIINNDADSQGPTPFDLSRGCLVEGRVLKKQKSKVLKVALIEVVTSLSCKFKIVSEVTWQILISSQVVFLVSGVYYSSFIGAHHQHGVKFYSNFLILFEYTNFYDTFSKKINLNACYFLPMF